MAYLSDYDAADGMKRVIATVKIRGMHKARFRVWLGVLILRLGCWVTGFGGLEIDTGSESRDGHE